jgi:hypothetical protein
MSARDPLIQAERRFKARCLNRRRWDLFPCRGPVVPCRTLLLVSATCNGTVKSRLLDQPLRDDICNQESRGGDLLPPRSTIKGLAGFDSKVVVHGDSQFLLAAEVPLSRLYRNVPEQKLNLIQLAAREMTQAGAGAPEIVGCQLFDS